MILKSDVGFFLLLVFCWYRPILVLGYCLYGDNPDCQFRCHCAVDSECDGGLCPSGCDEAPLGHNWRGPGCQIGNIGLGKVANQSATEEWGENNPASAALDGSSEGISPGQLCAHPAAKDGRPAEWCVDLGDVYKVYNITIYGRNECPECQEWLQQFDLTVYNTSNNEVLCAFHNDTIYTSETIECDRPLIGRYVHFRRRGGLNITAVTLCEVVIIGHKYIDCSECPADVSCNDVIGCKSCEGGYQPDCKQECEAGFYGKNCEETCGNCSAGTTCRGNGVCPQGCESWWIGAMCTTYVGRPSVGNEEVTITDKSSSSISVAWKQLRSFSYDLAKYYGYQVEYKMIGERFHIIGLSLSHNNQSAYLIDEIVNLEPNTTYEIRIMTYRHMAGSREYGDVYPDLVVKTEYAQHVLDDGRSSPATSTQKDARSSMLFMYLFVVACGAILILVVVIIGDFCHKNKPSSENVRPIKSTDCQLENFYLERQNDVRVPQEPYKLTEHTQADVSVDELQVGPDLLY